jgi:hypothetical protein
MRIPLDVSKFRLGNEFGVAEGHSADILIEPHPTTPSYAATLGYQRIFGGLPPPLA